MTDWLVGAYGPDMNGTARGIARLQSRADGSLAVVPNWLIELESPAFLARSGANVLAALEGRGEIAQVSTSALRVERQTGSGGRWPCHIADFEGTLIVANYFDGSLGVLDPELRLTQTLEAAPGSGPHAAQDAPHAHASVRVAPGVVLSADLGADRIHVHQLQDGVLTRKTSVALRPGFGPRDFLLFGDDADSRLLFVLGEHGRSVIVARWTGESLEILSETALPGAAEGDQASALAVFENHLYAGLRGSNQVAVLAMEGERLEAITSVSSEGEWPRYLVADGSVLHVANQESDSVASFSLASDGIPRLIAQPTRVASPTYLLAD